MKQLFPRFQSKEYPVTSYSPLYGLARALALAGLLFAAGASAIAPGQAEELKTVRIFFPPLNQGWTAGYELIEVANDRAISRNTASMPS
jgi:hypothetical protein